MDNDFKYILKKINDYFRNIVDDEHQKILGNESYAYWPTPLDFIVDALNLIKEKEMNFINKKFIDLGSGIGNICGIASNMGFEVHGIEINPKLYNISKQIYPEVYFHNMNIWEFSDYENFDIIFYYLPINDYELRLIFKERVENAVKIGSYIIVTEEEYQNVGKDDRFISIGKDKLNNRIWQKIKE